MDLMTLVIDVLKPIGIPTLWEIRPTEFPGISFHFFNEQSALHGDGGSQEEMTSCQIDIWHKRSYMEIKKQVKKLMKESGFLYDNASDTYENDVQLYHGVLTFNFYYESED